ncbi:MAG TPA: hypothetical protein PKE00_00440 [Planctomycetota bacterium]|nr:hypothetical protein [Planctomycetota bacterium]
MLGLVDLLDFVGNSVGPSVGDAVLEVRSRGGAWFVLLLFGSLFGILGAECFRQSWRRDHPLALSLGIALLAFGLPTWAIYSSSLDGYYEVRLTDDRFELVPLIAGFSKFVVIENVRRIEGRHAYKQSWRVHIETADGIDWCSATIRRERAAVLVKALEAARLKASPR